MRLGKNPTRTTFSLNSSYSKAALSRGEPREDGSVLRFPESRIKNLANLPDGEWISLDGRRRWL